MNENAPNGDTESRFDAEEQGFEPDTAQRVDADIDAQEDIGIDLDVPQEMPDVDLQEGFVA